MYTPTAGLKFAFGRRGMKFVRCWFAHVLQVVHKEEHKLHKFTVGNNYFLDSLMRCTVSSQQWDALSVLNNKKTKQNKTKQISSFQDGTSAVARGSISRPAGRPVTQYLIRSYGNFLVRRGSQHAWSPRFPDFTALHFYFSVYMTMVY
jgi:hypothetical protein